MYFVSRISLTIGRYMVCRREVCSKLPLKLPEEPTTCCRSGCANCVWIDYAEQVKNILAEDINSEEVRQMVLDKIQDPDMKAFLSMELKLKGF